MLIAACIVAAIWLRGELIRPSPKFTATISDSAQLARLVLQELQRCLRIMSGSHARSVLLPFSPKCYPVFHMILFIHHYVLVVLITLVSAFVGSYLGAYLRRKGENLASHEDIGKLVDQVKAITQTTKEIEAKISTDVWNRQKRWEMKREVLFSAAKALAEVDEALLVLSSTLDVDLNHDNSTWRKAFYERIIRWSSAFAAFDQARLLTAIVCGRETEVAFGALAQLANDIAVAISTTYDKKKYGASHSELAKRLFVARAAIRKELEIDLPARPQPEP